MASAGYINQPPALWVVGAQLTLADRMTPGASRACYFYRARTYGSLHSLVFNSSEEADAEKAPGM